MVLGITASGSLLNVVLIMKGKGTRLDAVELNSYSQLSNVIVLWQEKAWIDASRELSVIAHMIAPYVQATNASLGYKAEYLLTQDRGPGHDDEFAFTPSPIG